MNFSVLQILPNMYNIMASLVAQQVKNLPSMQKTQETQVESLSRRSPGGGNGNPLQFSCLENPMERGTWLAAEQKVCKKSDATEQISTCTHTQYSIIISTEN